MSKIYLMNSAVMPNEGKYDCKYVNQKTFIKAFHKIYDKSGTFVNCVGYEQTAKHLTELLGVDVPMNRVNVSLNSGDIMLVCKLETRVANPETKGQEQSTPFVYCVVKFT